MKKGILVLSILLLFGISGCTEQEPEILVTEENPLDSLIVFDEIGDYTILRTKNVKDDYVDTNLTFDGCTYNDSIVDFYVADGDEIKPLHTYFNSEVFTTEELINIGIPFTDCRTTNKELDEFFRYEPSTQFEVLHTIREFEVIEYTGLVCAMMIGPIVINSYNFGTRGMGCSEDLDWIGYRIHFDGFIYYPQDLIDAGYFTVTEFYELYYNNSLGYNQVLQLEEFECTADICKTSVTYEDFNVYIYYDIYSNFFKSYIIDSGENRIVYMFGRSGWGYSYDIEPNCNHYETSCPLGRYDDYDEYNKTFTTISDVEGLKTYLSDYIKTLFEE